MDWYVSSSNRKLYCFSGKLEDVGVATMGTEEENVDLVSEGDTKPNSLSLSFEVVQVLIKNLESFLAENLPVAASSKVIVTHRVGQG